MKVARKVADTEASIDDIARGAFLLGAYLFAMPHERHVVEAAMKAFDLAIYDPEMQLATETDIRDMAAILDRQFKFNLYG